MERRAQPTASKGVRAVTPSDRSLDADAAQRPELVPRRDHLRAPRAGVRRLQRRRHRRLRRADRRGSTTSPSSASPRSGCCRSTRRRCATTATTSPTTTTSTPTTATSAQFRRLLKAAHDARHPGRSPSSCSTTRPTSTRGSSGPAAPRPDRRERDFYVWSDTPSATPTPGSSSTTSRRRTGRGTRSPGPTSGTASTPTSPTSTSTTPRSRPAMLDALDFWLDMGVDGVRLDAVPYLFEREGTNCENLPETHEFLKRLRTHVDARYPDRMLLGRGQPVARGRRRLLRRRRRVPHELPLPADAAAVHGAAHGGPLADHRHPRADAGRCPRAASGRCSCATTTS